jgi:hypothetical protein
MNTELGVGLTAKNHFFRSTAIAQKSLPPSKTMENLRCPDGSLADFISKSLQYLSNWTVMGYLNFRKNIKLTHVSLSMGPAEKKNARL